MRILYFGDMKIAKLLAKCEPKVFGLKIGVHWSTVYRWKTQQSLPAARLIPIIALALGKETRVVERAWEADKRERA